MLNKLVQAGITFLPEVDNEALIDIDHRKALIQNWKQIQSLKERADIYEQTAKQLTESQYLKEYDNLIERSQKILEKAYNDPVYAQKKAQISKAADEWLKSVEYRYSGLPFAKTLGEKLQKEANNKEVLARIPDDALLSSAVNKYATGWEAEFAKLLTYVDLRKRIQDGDGSAEAIRSNPQVLAGIKRLEQAETQAKKYCYDKCYRENLSRCHKAVEDYETAVKEYDKAVQGYVREDAVVIIPLVSKLLNNPKAMEGVTDSMYREVKKLCASLEDKKEISFIDCTFVFRVWQDHIDYFYADDYFRKPDSFFNFEENNYRILENDMQMTALALVAGQTLTYRLKADPAFELANIKAKYGVQRVTFTLSYPNPKHTQTISFF